MVKDTSTTNTVREETVTTVGRRPERIPFVREVRRETA